MCFKACVLFLTLREVSPPTGDTRQPSEISSSSNPELFVCFRSRSGQNIVYTPGQPKVRLPCGHTTYDIRQSHPRVRVTPRSRCRCPNIHDLHSYAMPMQCGPRSCLWAASLASSCCTRRICNGFSPSCSLKSSSVRPPSISPLTMFSLKAEQTASAKPRSRRANPLASPLGQGL